MRNRTDSSSPPTAAPLVNVFTSAFLDRLADRDESLTAGEADLAGPWKQEPLPGRPGAIAVLRAWEDLAVDAPEGVFWHPETARLLALALPLLGREPLFHLAETESAEGYAVSAVYGEQGSETAGWLRRYEPRVVEALHLLEGLTRWPAALAALLEVAGPGALEQVGRILAGWVEESGEK
jgi:hypothetical protein